MAAKQTEIEIPPAFNMFATAKIEDIPSPDSAGVYLDKKCVHDLVFTDVKVKFLPSTNTERIYTSPETGREYPGMNFIIEGTLGDGSESTQEGVKAGRKVSIYWSMDMGQTKQRADFTMKEIAEALMALDGSTFSDALVKLKTEALTAFEDEDQYKGLTVRVYSKQPRNKKDGTIDKFRNLAYEVINREEQTEAESPAVIEKTPATKRRGVQN
jgi:hypothetical protein